MSRKDALSIFEAAISAVLPAELIRRNVKLDDEHLALCGVQFNRKELGRVLVVGAGKASAAMAFELEHILKEVIDAGLIITKYGHGPSLRYCNMREAGHPVPDANGLTATQELLQLTTGLKQDDLVIFLLSGGASSLLIDHPQGSSLQEIQRLSIDLLNSGADIHEINCVRKHVSLLKGGQLAKHFFPASVVSLIISDVTGDDLSSIGSGPTSPDKGTFDQAKLILTRYGLYENLSPSLKLWIDAGVRADVPETPKAGDALFTKVRNFIIGSNKLALQSAADAASALGYAVREVSAGASGETEQVAIDVVDETVKYSGPTPACLLWGGETTIRITGSGTGGRNQHLALSALVHMRDTLSYADDFPTILSAGTDGTDGPTDAAGAVIDKQTLINAEISAIDIDMFHEQQDSYHFFQLAGGHIITGPTQTNVMDLVIAIIP